MRCVLAAPQRVVVGAGLPAGADHALDGVARGAVPEALGVATVVGMQDHQRGVPQPGRFEGGGEVALSKQNGKSRTRGHGKVREPNSTADAPYERGEEGERRRGMERKREGREP